MWGRPPAVPVAGGGGLGRVEREEGEEPIRSHKTEGSVSHVLPWRSEVFKLQKRFFKWKAYFICQGWQVCSRYSQSGAQVLPPHLCLCCCHPCSTLLVQTGLPCTWIIATASFSILSPCSSTLQLHRFLTGESDVVLLLFKSPAIVPNCLREQTHAPEALPPEWLSSLAKFSP